MEDAGGHLLICNGLHPLTSGSIHDGTRARASLETEGRLILILAAPLGRTTAQGRVRPASQIQ
jgi:hypothetical protein